MDDPSFLPREDAYEALYSKDKRRKKKTMDGWNSKSKNLKRKFRQKNKKK